MRDLVICAKCGTPTGNKASQVCNKCKMIEEDIKEEDKSEKRKEKRADKIAASFVWTIINDFKPPQQWDADGMQAVRRDLRHRFITYGKSIQEGDFDNEATIPEEFVEERIDEAQKLTIFGRPLADLNREELMAATVYAFEEDHQVKTGGDQS